MMEERIRHPEQYDPAAYFQRSWSGSPFANKPWVDGTERALASASASKA